MLELGQTFSMEQMVIDNDIIAMNYKILEGVPVTDETLDELTGGKGDDDNE